VAVVNRHSSVAVATGGGGTAVAVASSHRHHAPSEPVARPAVRRPCPADDVLRVRCWFSCGAKFRDTEGRTWSLFRGDSFERPFPSVLRGRLWTSEVDGRLYFKDRASGNVYVDP
jgi:hypothetical protein